MFYAQGIKFMSEENKYASKVQVLEILESKIESVGVEGGRILASELYCRNGHPLITPENPRYDNKLAIKVMAESGGKKQPLYLSPFQRDVRKKISVEFKSGQILRLSCPECGDEFPRVAPHDCHDDAMHVALFMRADGNVQKSVCICNAWDCYASFAKLFNEVITDLRRYQPKPIL